MFHGHSNHILQPTIDKIINKKEPDKALLLKLAFDLVNFAPNLYNFGDYYSTEEKEKAKALLKKYGYGDLCNCSARWKQRTLEKIEAEQAGISINLCSAASGLVVEER